MKATDCQSEAFFEARYQASDDPWEFASSSYELTRYHATLEALKRSSYRRAYEPGCSVGVLTLALSKRCDHLIACDISRSAVQRAQKRCEHCCNVEINQQDAKDGPPPGTFDLIVFSEMGYYLSGLSLKALAQDLAMRLEPGGEFVAVHWLGHSADHLLHGDEVHDLLGASLGCDSLGGSRHAGFRINSWRRAS